MKIYIQQPLAENDTAEIPCVESYPSVLYNAILFHCCHKCTAIPFGLLLSWFPHAANCKEWKIIISWRIGKWDCSHNNMTTLKDLYTSMNPECIATELIVVEVQITITCLMSCIDSITFISQCSFLVTQSKAARWPFWLPISRCRPFLEYFARYGPKSRLSSNIFVAAAMSTFSAMIFWEIAVVLASSSTWRELKNRNEDIF